MRFAFGFLGRVGDRPTSARTQFEEGGLRGGEKGRRGEGGGYCSLILAICLAQGRLRTCLAKMEPFYWATVSAVKMPSLSPFCNGKKKSICISREPNGAIVSKLALSCSLTRNMFFVPAFCSWYLSRCPA